jgi:hypothetical protein
MMSGIVERETVNDVRNLRDGNRKMTPGNFEREMGNGK